MPNDATDLQRENLLIQTAPVSTLSRFVYANLQLMEVYYTDTITELINHKNKL